jgi:hypothetical protein
MAVDNFVSDIMNEERGKRETELRGQAVPAPEPATALTREPPPPPQAELEEDHGVSTANHAQRK